MGIIVFVWFICAIVSAIIAHRKKRNVVGWFFAGLLLGPIGVIIVVIIKSKNAAGQVGGDSVNSPLSEVKSQVRFREPTEEEEHLQSLLRQATELRDTDIETAIRIVEEVIGKYEQHNESFTNLIPTYFKLAHYYQKKGDYDKAWGIYNRVVLKAMQEDDIQILGMHL